MNQTMGLSTQKASVLKRHLGHKNMRHIGVRGGWGLLQPITVTTTENVTTLRHYVLTIQLIMSQQPTIITTGHFSELSVQFWIEYYCDIWTS